MKKVIKNKTNKKTYLIMFFGIIVGVIISIASSYVIAETLIKSTDVSYVDNSKLGATNVQAAIDGTCTKFSNELSNFLNKIYPVGSIYISTANTNPSTFLGGTWENYADGRVLKGIKSGTAGTTGGSSTVTLSTSNLPAHTHTYDKTNANTGSHTLTIDEIPSHSHKLLANLDSGVVSGHIYEFTNGTNTWYFSSVGALNHGDSGNSGGSKGHTHPISTTSTNTGSAGSSNPTAISVQDPYVTVYMWRRTK